jgi:isopentenyl diphosphate isomerase/L-lactate dehydrogenase-like FMN-dependent dehydrogenase
MVGDGADPEKYKVGLKAIAQNQGWGIPIFKPRTSDEEIIKRIRAAEDSGALAVGMDIDAACFITMKLKSQAVEPKTASQLKKIIKSTKLPFIIKGIMSVEDALRSVDAGAKVLYLSNHGGRVLDYMPAALSVLPLIRKKVGRKIKIMIDGGFREGLDIQKALMLGADYIAIGRPFTIAAVGGGEKGVELQAAQYYEELRQAMILGG